MSNELMQNLHCRQCAVWKPIEQVTFKHIEEALWHIINVHPNRAMWLLLSIGYDSFKEDIYEALRDRCKEGELT